MTDPAQVLERLKTEVQNILFEAYIIEQEWNLIPWQDEKKTKYTEIAQTNKKFMSSILHKLMRLTSMYPSNQELQELLESVAIYLADKQMREIASYWILRN